MKFIETRLFLKCGLIFSLIQLLLYVPLHLGYTGVLNDLGEGALVVIGALTSALTEIASFVLPIVAATVIFISYAYKGLLHALLRVPVFSLPYFIAAIPENYLTYLSAFDSLGAIFFSLLISFLIVIAVTTQILALFGIICIFFKIPKVARFERKTLLPLEAEDAFDFSAPFAKGLFFAVLTQFLIALIPEIISTITYIAEGKGSYRATELLTIVLTFLFITVEMVIAYVLAFKLKNKLIYERLATEDGES